MRLNLKKTSMIFSLLLILLLSLAVVSAEDLESTDSFGDAQISDSDVYLVDSDSSDTINQAIAIEENSENNDIDIKYSTYDIEYDYSQSTDKAFWPETLVNDILSSITINDKVILDPFMGSGEIGKKALKMDAKFIGYDIDGEILTLNGWEID